MAGTDRAGTHFLAGLPLRRTTKPAITRPPTSQSDRPPLAQPPSQTLASCIMGRSCCAGRQHAQARPTQMVTGPRRLREVIPPPLVSKVCMKVSLAAGMVHAPDRLEPSLRRPRARGHGALPYAARPGPALRGDQFLDPVSRTIVIMMQHRFIVPVQDRVVEVARRLPDHLAGETDIDLGLAPADAIDPPR